MPSTDGQPNTGTSNSVLVSIAELNVTQLLCSKDTYRVRRLPNPPATREKYNTVLLNLNRNRPKILIHEDMRQHTSIKGFHGGDYEEWRLLECYAVWLL
jgi:hypothetical protein